MADKMNVIWAEPEIKERRWTREMVEALGEMQDIPDLEGQGKEGGEGEEGEGDGEEAFPLMLPPLIELTEKRKREAFQIHIHEMHGKKNFEPGYQPPKPLSEQERWAHSAQIFKYIYDTIF